MKQLLIILLTLGTISPLCALGSSSSSSSSSRQPRSLRVPEAAQESFVEKYIDMGDLIISIGRLYKRKKADAKSICIALIEALDFNKLPLKLEDDRETVIGEFFKGDELKECVSTFLGHLFDKGKLKKRHIAEAIEKLKESLKMDAIEAEFGEQEWIDIEKTLDALIAYYDGEEADEDIEDIIDLENAPALFGFIIQDYFIIEKLNEALAKALKGESFTKGMLLDCLDIEQIALRQGYENLPNTDGIREAIELFLTTMEEDLESSRGIFDILGDYRATKNALIIAQQEDARPARSNNAHRRQLAADQAYAQRLAAQSHRGQGRSSSNNGSTNLRNRFRPAHSSSREESRQIAHDAAFAQSLADRFEEGQEEFGSRNNGNAQFGNSFWPRSVSNSNSQNSQIARDAALARQLAQESQESLASSRSILHQGRMRETFGNRSTQSRSANAGRQRMDNATLGQLLGELQEEDSQ